MDRESTMQEPDGSTYTKVERGDGRWVASQRFQMSALVVTSTSRIIQAIA